MAENFIENPGFTTGEGELWVYASDGPGKSKLATGAIVTSNIAASEISEGKVIATCTFPEPIVLHPGDSFEVTYDFKVEDFAGPYYNGEWSVYYPDTGDLVKYWYEAQYDRYTFDFLYQPLGKTFRYTVNAELIETGQLGPEEIMQMIPDEVREQPGMKNAIKALWSPDTSHIDALTKELEYLKDAAIKAASAAVGLESALLAEIENKMQEVEDKISAAQSVKPGLKLPPPGIKFKNGGPVKMSGGFIQVPNSNYNPALYITPKKVSYGSQLGRMQAVSALPALNEIVKHPVTKELIPLESCIINLNDAYKWTREQIADWLETLDVDITFKTPKKSKITDL